MNSFFAMLYDWLEYHNDFSIFLFDSHNYSGYTYLGAIIIFCSIVFMSLFYYAWNPTYGRWYHWLFIVILSAIVAAIVTYSYLSNTLIEYVDNSKYPDTESFIINISLMTSFYTFIFSLLSSFVIRIWSSKNKANPFALNLR